MKSAFTSQPFLSRENQAAPDTKLMVPALGVPTKKVTPRAIDWARALPTFRTDEHLVLFLVECLLDPKKALAMSSATKDEAQRKLLKLLISGKLPRLLQTWKDQATEEQRSQLEASMQQGLWALLFLKPNETILSAA